MAGDKSIHINGMCLFGAWRRKAPTAPSVELDDKYKRLRRVVAKQAHKAQWHNERNVPIMRVPSVSPCVAVPWVPSNEAQRGNGIGETP